MGTRKYRPPEMMQHVRSHPSIDIFSFGVMVDKIISQVCSSDDASGVCAGFIPPPWFGNGSNYGPHPHDVEPDACMVLADAT
eukprot:COSAG01_NODE_570_length_15328_cov_82.520783_12_plen_82_part_00